MNSGIFIVSELEGAVRERVAAVQRRYDPKLARTSPPHITLVGSSGVGPLAGDTPLDELRAALGPIAAETPPITVRFGVPIRFMQTDIIVLPIDPHGPLRTLHERIATSGLIFLPARFAFSPHCTLSFYPRLTRETERELLAVRETEPVVIGRLQCYLTMDPQPSRKVLEVVLGDREAGSAL